MSNAVFISGNVGQDPKSYGKDKIKLYTFSVAVSEYQHKTKDFKTHWVGCKYFSEKDPGIKKGDKVHVEGRLEQDVWEKDGKKQSSLNVVARTLLKLEREEKPEAKAPNTKPQQNEDDFGF